MKKLLLLTSVGMLSLTAFPSEVPAPEKLENSFAYAMSPNGQYIVSCGMSGTKLFDLATGKVTDFAEETGDYTYSPGIANCVSDNGIVVGGPESYAPQYWKDGEWHDLELPANSLGGAYSQSITPDGFRICGSVKTAVLNMDDDTLMLEPCVWSWDAEKGEYGKPLMLPHPEVDFSGRVPQYITALDISDDGKTVIGQVRTATGMIHYPIIYSENEDGEWSYRTLFEDKILPEGVTFPEYPGENPAHYPEYTDYMTADEIEAYNAAFEAWYASGFVLPYPEYQDYMTPEEFAAYEKALADAEAMTAAWGPKFEAWMDVLNECIITWADFQYNSIRISPDGKQFANTMLVPGEPDYDEIGFIPEFSNIWVFDINGEVVAKYDQADDYTLTYFANDGVVLASSSSSGLPQSFVLANGKTTGMKDWITSRIPEYSTWIDENMTFEIERYVEDPETGDWVADYSEATMTGKAYSNPDLSIIALGLDNYWDYMDDGMTCVFDMKTGSAVSPVRPAEGETVIYDLNGRRLKNADAPGIYIINGEKKVVR